ncbi:MAG TPA: hypothetical protein VMX13_09415 [Sedimentisphaerales bacterium]|nr:hypothetical protein [Sedimentisphaerales bacterium]
MALRYMVSDTDLAAGRVSVPEQEPVAVVKSPSASRKRLWFLLLLLANVISWTYLYALWSGRQSELLRLLPFNRAMVTGIIYQEQNPCAIVRGRVAHEGDMIDGYKVVKIHKDRVEFEKNGRIVIRQVYDP